MERKAMCWKREGEGAEKEYHVEEEGDGYRDGGERGGREGRERRIRSAGR